MLSAIRERLVNFLKKEDSSTAVQVGVMLGFMSLTYL